MYGIWTISLFARNFSYLSGGFSLNFNILVDGGWGEWSQWSTCTKPCGGSVVNRTRACNNPTPAYSGKNCSGSGLQYKLECLAACPGNSLLQLGTENLFHIKFKLTQQGFFSMLMWALGYG